MNLEINIFSLILITIGLIVGVSCFYISLLVKNVTRTVVLTMFCAAIWGFFYGLELQSSNLEQILIYIKIEYLGIAFIGSLWFVFTLNYTSYQSPHKKWIVISTFIIPVLCYLMLLTNESHHLFYSHIEMRNTGSLKTIKLEPGLWYFINMVNVYVMFALGTYILWKRLKHADQLFQTQTRLILISVILPLGFNGLYQTGILKPLGVIDLTPFTFLITYLVVSFAVLKYNLFGIKPLAQGKIIEAITKGVLVMNNSSQIIDYNPALIHFLQNPTDLHNGTDGENLFANQQEIVQLLKNHEEKTIEVQLDREGTTLIFNVESIYLYENKSVLTGMILLFEDITEQQQLTQQLTKQTEELLQLNQLKDKYFSIISHDLKGPIYGVKELIHLAQSDIISTEEFIDLLPEMSKNMEQVSLLLENLLAWTASQIRGERVVKTNFDINHILKEQSVLLARIATQKKIDIIVSTESEIRITADKNMVELIVRNLLSNAIKFSGKRSEIKVTSEIEADQCKICIVDKGLGISNEFLEKIKDGVSFTTSGKNNETGTGLGLILVKEYVEKNDGKMEISSELGLGSTFSIYFPLAKVENIQLA